MWKTLEHGVDILVPPAAAVAVVATVLYVMLAGLNTLGLIGG